MSDQDWHADATEMTRQVVAYGLDARWNAAIEAAAQIADEERAGIVAYNIRRLKRDPSLRFSPPSPRVPGNAERGGL